MGKIHWAVLLSLGMTAAAWARDPVRTREKHEPGPDRDIELKVESGLKTYTGAAAAFTRPGISYGVLVATDLVSILDGELSYQGAAYSTDSRLGARNTILENGGQALLMLSPTFGKVEPYVFSGLGVSRISVLERVNPVPQIQDATHFRLPVGAGLDFVPAGDGGGEADFLIGARVKYDVTLDAGAFPTLDSRMSANELTTTIQVGASF